MQTSPTQVAPNKHILGVGTDHLVSKECSIGVEFGEFKVVWHFVGSEEFLLLWVRLQIGRRVH